MGKLIRMDLYRLLKSRSFLVCLGLNFLLALGDTPFAKLMFTLARSLSTEVNEAFPAEASLSAILTNPFPLMGMMLALLSLCFFYHADMEHGYIKNIAGQMPMKGFTVLSKFIVTALHNLFFVVTGIIGDLMGTLFIQRLIMDADVPETIRLLVLKLLLLQSICAILLLGVATFRSKSLGMILAVLFGLGLTPLIYRGINEALRPLFGQSADISKFMPDAVMAEIPLDTVKALAVSLVFGGVFLLLAIRIFDRKDVK